MRTPTRAECPYYELVPKDLRSNLKFRESMVRLGYSSQDAARDLWRMCARDILFYINTFCFLYEPREARILPWLTYDFQDEALLELLDAIETGVDVAILKSRDMGASWMCMSVVEWRWKFHDMYRFSGMSEKDDLVDKTGEPKSLFYKFDFLGRHQPAWLQPVNAVERHRNHARNLDNGSTFDGQSTTATSGTADRCTAVILDEFSKMGTRGDLGFSILTATRDVTRCRIFNFTPNGTGNAAYTVAQNENIRQLRLHWSRHPDKSKGLYTAEGGELKLLSRWRGMVARLVRGKVDWVRYPEEYPFILDGKLRSPAYDFEEARADDPTQMAQEWDMDFLGSIRPFFDHNKLDQLCSEIVRMPLFIGDMDYDSEACQPAGFREHEGGRLRLWCPVDVAGDVPKGDYAVGADVSMGTGASNSVLSVVDLMTGEKVGEYVNPYIVPQDFARFAVSICRKFHSDREEPAFLIWEGTGPGNVFTDAVIESGFRRMYYRRDEQRILKQSSDRPGWYPTRDAKKALLQHYRQGLQQMTFLNRSRRAIDECRLYRYSNRGEPEYGGSVGQRDPSGAGANHGDRVIADALAHMILRQKQVVQKSAEPEMPPYCYAARRRAWENKQKEGSSWLSVA